MVGPDLDDQQQQLEREAKKRRRSNNSKESAGEPEEEEDSELGSGEEPEDQKPCQRNGLTQRQNAERPRETGSKAVSHSRKAQLN